jgi:hypothetical protein
MKPQIGDIWKIKVQDNFRYHMILEDLEPTYGPDLYGVLTLKLEDGYVGYLIINLSIDEKVA